MNNTMEDGLMHESNLGYALVYGCILALGLPLNAVSLWILLRRHSLKSPSVVFMVNLAISDLLLAISLPMRVYFYATGTWPLSPEACIWTTMLFRNNIRSSSIFITFISVDRLLAVVYPLRSRHLRTASNALKAVVLVWLFVLALNIPETLEFSKFIKRKNNSTCFEFQHRPKVTINNVSQRSYHKSAFATYLPSVLTLILLAVNVVCTTSVSWTLRSDSARVNNKVNVMLIFVMNLVMFIICFLPVTVHLLFLGLPVSTPLVCLASFNCCLDPLLYYFSLDAFLKNKEDIELAREPDHGHTIFMH
ncbi:lysophosphatidic acid receptor 6-like [Perca fluviatilis]|uniref:lysophosphatidic acid receptor 6-like n=1 Tax=Perca fluviatilis TaxID=8168 RepID=UPI001966733E|nr:lysophosphatidic acid receptor 6-like [Perca fluviatilis]